MASDEHTPVTTFELIQFNAVRHMRGKQAAKIAIYEDGDQKGFLWMSPDDLRANIKDFGTCPALEKALRAYGEQA